MGKQERAIAMEVSGLASDWPSLWTVGRGRLLGKGLDHRLS